MKLYFDRARSVFPSSVRLGEQLTDKFAPVIVYDQLEEPTDVFFGARFDGTEYLLWQQTQDGTGELTLVLDSDITVSDFLREMLQVLPSSAKSMSYQWILGYSTGVMEGYVTDTWDATTRIEASEIGWEKIAAVVGIAAIVVGAIVTGERR